MNTQHAISAFIGGTLFALGLGISGMTQPSKVVGFLDVTGSWDPSLAFVMIGAIAVHFVVYRLVLRMSNPVFGHRFAVPTRSDIDARLVVGASLFGMGWGLAGYCPGPAVVSLPGGAASAGVFVGAMLAGMLLFRGVDTLWQRRQATQQGTHPVADALKA